MKTRSLIYSLICTMTLRAWWQQGKSAALLALSTGILLGASTLLMQSGVNGLPEQLPAGLFELATVTAQGILLEVNTFMVALSPVLLALLCALLATMITPSVVSEDVRGGLLEVLLTTPLGKSRIFTAYLGAAVLLTGLCWCLCSMALFLTWAALTTLLPLTLHLSAPLLWMLTILPLSMTLWATSTALTASLLYPNSLDAGAGVGSSPARLVALAPTILLLPATLLATQHLWEILLGGFIFASSAAFFLIVLTARRFRTVHLLA